MNPARPKWAAVARWYAAVLLFLAPLKFGGVIGLGDDACFPMDGWQWAFFVWPPFLVSALAGVAYVLAVLGHPAPATGPGRWPVMAWSLLVFAVLPGLLLTTEWDYALPFVSHLASAAVFAAAVRRLLAHDDAARQVLLGAVAAATLWCCITGVRQRFGGLEETQIMIEQQAAAQGQALDSELHDKLRQTRVYGRFQIANLYAAHLVLVAPLMLLVLWRVGGRFEPARVSRALLVGLGALAFLGAVYWSGSRGAVLGLAAGLGLGTLSLPALRRWRIPIVLLSVVLGLGLMFAVGGNRNLLSAKARVEYYRSAWTMFREHPLRGAGLGEFYPEHLRLRPLGAEPTRMPHNFPLGLLGQAGILAGLAALACLLIPAWLALKPDDDRRPWHERVEQLAVIVGVGAWSVHALVDLNVQVPGTLITAACLPLFALRERGGDGETSPGRWWQRFGRVGQLVLVAIALAGIWRWPGEHAFQQFDDAVRAQRPLDQVWRQGQAAARLLPTSSNPDRILGRVAEATGSGAGAVEAYQRAVRRSPHRAGLWGSLARARLLQNDLPGAAAAAAMAVEWNPGAPRHQAHLALIRGLRLAQAPARELAPLVNTALTASYELGEPSTPPAMNVQIRWPKGAPPPAIPLQQVADWLSPHAGFFPSGNLPVRFHVAPAWTNGR